MENDEIISRIGANSLGEISEVIYGTTPEGGVFEDEGVPFIRSQNFYDHIISSDYVFCTNKFHIEHENSKCLPRDLLFAAIGATIGDFAIVPTWINEANTNQNIARVRINSQKYRAEYVWAFFLSQYGQLQLHRYPTGNAQPYLNTYQFNRLKIPFIKNQEKFTQLVQDIFKLIESSDRLYPEAEQELLKRMEWDKVTTNHRLSYSATSKDILTDERLDPEFYQPKFENLEKHLKKVGSLAIEKVCNFVNHGIQPPYFENGTVSVVTQKEMTPTFLELESIKDFTSADFYNENPDFKLKKHDVLLYSVGAYIGRCNILLDEIKAMAGSYVTILRANGDFIVPEYLALFLNSTAGVLQSRQQMRGTAQHYLYPRDIKKIKVFIPRDKNGKPDLAWQKKLAAKVIQANEAKKFAQQKLQEAKELVEQEIEKLMIDQRTVI
ncbi:MAG: restriction endonuclease subunit S [Candidatus Taylorbacteria bacterium]